MALRRLLRRARAYLRAELPLPLDLFAALHDAGVNVEELHFQQRINTRD